jgi:hypothetical protein
MVFEWMNAECGPRQGLKQVAHRGGGAGGARAKEQPQEATLAQAPPPTAPRTTAESPQPPLEQKAYA